MSDSTIIRSVMLSNYKSIRQCSVKLHPLTFLVGPNGSGKSNFLDALRFVSDSLRYSLEHAFRERGGIAEVRRRSGGHPNNFGIRLDFSLPSDQSGFYSFRVVAKKGGGYEIQEEQCQIGNASFTVKSGRVTSMTTAGSHPVVSPDRLYLVQMSGEPVFRPLYDVLSNMGFYNMSPDQIRELQSPGRGDLLARDGSNITSVLAQLQRQHPDTKARIEQYLERIVPGIEGVSTKVMGPRETLEFRQRVAGAKDPWNFIAANMSDGTLRALGTLVALLQTPGAPNKRGVVGIEEPETALHPGAAAVLLDALRDASSGNQVIVTSHSPDLLDNVLPVESLLAVQSIEGETVVTPVDAASREALQSSLYTPGELLRLNQLQPDQDQVERLRKSQLRLFETLSA